jgi:hypothetical protein
MKPTTLGLIVILVVASPPGLEAQSSERTDAHLRNDCRLASQVLTTGEPHTLREWAMDRINDCDESGGQVIAGLWDAPPSDTVGLGRLYRTASGLLDRRLVEAVVAAASDASNATLVRVTALRVLATYVDPLVDASLASLTPPSAACEGMDAAACGRMALVGHTDYRRQTEGTEPPSPGGPDAIRTLLASLATSDPDSAVRFAAGRLAGSLAETGP